MTFTVADVNFPGPGTYHVVIRTDSSELGRETFEVRASRLLSESTDGDSDVTGTSPQPRAADTAQGQSEDEADDVRAWHPRS